VEDTVRAAAAHGGPPSIGCMIEDYLD